MADLHTYSVQEALNTTVGGGWSVSSAGTGHFYTTTKNKKTMPDKMEIKKFDPVVRKYVTYTEKKIK